MHSAGRGAFVRDLSAGICQHQPDLSGLRTLRGSDLIQFFPSDPRQPVFSFDLVAIERSLEACGL
jgi:hypothetical protein